MALNFPDTPTVGQIFGAYTWDGAKWAMGSVGPFLAQAGGQTTTGGFRFTGYNGGTLTAGQTFTPNAYNHNYQYYTNNGAHTIAAPANDCAIDILITNGASAGAITFTGFTVSASIGDALTTTSANRFVISIRRINAVATYIIKALQ